MNVCEKGHKERVIKAMFDIKKKRGLKIFGGFPSSHVIRPKARSGIVGTTVKYAVTAERCHSHVGKKSFSYLLECHILYSYASDLFKSDRFVRLNESFPAIYRFMGII